MGSAEGFDAIDCKQINVGKDEKTAGRTGRNALFRSTTNVKLGGWFNAAKAELHFGSAGTGEITGMASAFNAELYLPNKHMAGGVYTGLEVNLNFQASSTMAHSAVYPKSLASFKAGGTAARIVEWSDGASGCIFAISGLVSKAGSAYDATQGPAAANASFRVNIAGINYYVMLSTTAN